MYLKSTLELPQHDEVRQRSQALGLRAETGQSVLRVGPQFLGQSAGPANAEHTHVSRLVGGGVFACSLAKRRRRGLAIEHVVNHLERESNELGVTIQMLQFISGEHRTAARAQCDRSPDESARLADMH